MAIRDWISAGCLAAMTSTNSADLASMVGSVYFFVGSADSKSSDLAGDTTISTGRF